MIDVALREDNRQVLESTAILATPLLETLLNIAQGLLMAINVALASICSIFFSIPGIHLEPGL